MVNLRQNHSLLISVVLFIYTVLIVLPLYQGGSASRDFGPDAFISPILGIIVLFVIVLVIIIRLHDQRSRSKITELESRLNLTEETKTSVELDYRQQLEKQLFEIGVINAALNREIAERIQAETKSRELGKKMELILNSAGEGIFGLDIDGTVTFVNTAAALMTGWEPDEMLGRSHHDLVHHSYADGSPHLPEDCLINQACRDGQVHSSSDDFFWNLDGSKFPVEYVSTPIVDDGKLCGAVVVFRDKSTFT
ncbi:MAG: PAS domain-containing protein [Desulfofustis sp.]|jgi:PAS domain S-box-containing protein